MFRNLGRLRFNSHHDNPSSTMHPQDFAIPVTLTSRKDPTDIRQLTLVLGEPRIVGRSSKSKSNLEASPTNALFDCPVVSREHAQLRAHPWAASHDQVSIVDLGSMHGTRVNGTLLERGKSMSLRSGDLLQFGERVTRGDDTHEGVVVTFDRMPTGNTQNSHTFVASQPIGRSCYYVPDMSDDEDSDSPVEDAGYKISDDEERKYSSAHTTPEQDKAKPGSAEQPIDLDSLAPRTGGLTQIIDLDDDDEEDDHDRMPPPPRPSGARGFAETHVLSSQRVVQDSVDQDNSIYHPANLARGSHAPLTVEDEDDVSYQQLGLNGVLDDYAPESSHKYAPKSPSDVESSDLNDDIESHGAEEAEERSDDEHNDDNPDEDYPSDEDSPYDVEDEDQEEEEMLSPKKQPSPELGSMCGYPSLSDSAPPKNSSSSSFNAYNISFSPPKPPTQTHQPYDPVRNSQDSVKQPLIAPYPYTGASPFGHGWACGRPSTYTYGDRPLPNWPTFGGGFGANNFNSSRWDVPPPRPRSPQILAMPPEPVESAAPRPPISSVPQFTPFEEPFEGLYKPRSSSQRDSLSVLPSSLSLDGNQPFGMQHPWDTVPPISSYQDPCGVKSPLLTTSAVAVEAAKRSVGPAATPIQPTEPTKNKISIGDIVEDATSAVEKPIDDLVKKTTSSGSKRKAAEISSEEIELEPTTPVIPEEMMDVYETLYGSTDPVTLEDKVEEPPALKRTKTEPQATGVDEVIEKRVRSENGVAQVAKYAGSAVLGGVATMAFLCSPLAEKALEWLA